MRFLPSGPLNRALVIVLAVAVLAAGGYLGYTYVLADDPSCAVGVERRGPQRECVGVTDGGYVFTDELKQVSARIKAENDRVADSSPVTVALMIPMTSDAPAERRELVEQVQGAYLAQHWANDDANSDKRRPPIRLVLANPGRGYQQWRPVADQLARAAADDTQNLRAVAGINISIAETEQAVRYLTADKHIPVVAGPMTADDIRNTAADPRRYPGLARIAPGNSDQAGALGSYGANTRPEEALVIEDTRENDNYLATLRQTFEKLTKGAPNAPETYQSPPDFNDEGNLANDFHQMVPNICTSAATTLYFAGRPVQLRQFLVELGNRKCNKPYTVVTGSHASTLMVDAKFADKWDSLTAGAGITVRYTALAHPDTWGERSTATTGGSKKASKDLADLLDRPDTKAPDAIGPADLRDGRVIITYDSVSTAVAGIRNQTVRDVKTPSTDDVVQSWRRLHGTSRVDGASGWICLDQYGNPYNKAVPIVHLDPATRNAVLDALAWPLGHAPDANCSIGGDG
ncbi:hypothetical protein ABZW03_08155 [Kitasatospora sp. NPDC004799]|uniref:hypothetical protein n=1 Tax=Kitasatospora sp. NPDC004799 TaxID=3154460 RepID=UPI0033B5A0B0